MLNRRNTTILVAVCLALFPAVAQAQSYGAEAIGSALPSLMLIILSVMVGGGLLTIATYLLWHHFRGPLNHKFVASVGGCVLPSVTNLVGALAIFYALFEPSANMNELLVVIGVPIWAI